MAIWDNRCLLTVPMNGQHSIASSGTEPKLYRDVRDLLEKGINKMLWYDEIQRINTFEKRNVGLLSPSVNFHTSQLSSEFVDGKHQTIALGKLGEHYGIRRKK